MRIPCTQRMIKRGRGKKGNRDRMGGGGDSLQWAWLCGLFFSSNKDRHQQVLHAVVRLHSKWDGRDYKRTHLIISSPNAARSYFLIFCLESFFCFFRQQLVYFTISEISIVPRALSLRRRAHLQLKRILALFYTEDQTATCGEFFCGILSYFAIHNLNC